MQEDCIHTVADNNLHNLFNNVNKMIEFHEQKQLTPSFWRIQRFTLESDYLKNNNEAAVLIYTRKEEALSIHLTILTPGETMIVHKDDSENGKLILSAIPSNSISFGSDVRITSMRIVSCDDLDQSVPILPGKISMSLDFFSVES